MEEGMNTESLSALLDGIGREESVSHFLGDSGPALLCDAVLGFPELTSSGPAEDSLFSEVDSVLLEPTDVTEAFLITCPRVLAILLLALTLRLIWKLGLSEGELLPLLDVSCGEGVAFCPPVFD